MNHCVLLIRGLITVDNVGTVSSGYIALSDGSRIKSFCFLLLSPKTVSYEMGRRPQLTCHRYS